jgi:AcrR family transcriptional regulator
MSLDHAAVIDAGAALVKRRGIDSLGVRPLAADLGVTPMALYRHVKDAASLHASVVEALLAGVPEVPTTGTWRSRCRSWAVGTRAGLTAYPGLAHHVLLHWVRLPRILAVVDQLGTTLAEGPLGIDAVAASNAVFTYTLMRVQAEEAVRFGSVERDLSALVKQAKELPFLWANREEYAVARLDEHFAYGLDALLDGLATAHRKRRRADP